MTRLLYVVTDPMSANLFLKEQAAWMRSAGYRVAVVSAPGEGLEKVRQVDGVEVFAVPMRREISPMADCLTLVRLGRVFSTWRPDIVNAGTPKAGLLASVAGMLGRVPVRVYSQWGLRLETTKGSKRIVLKVAERMSCAAATSVVAVSHSLAARCLELGIVQPQKLAVLCHGSANGVRTERFALRNEGEVEDVARLTGIPKGSVVIGFVGRLTRDKGIVELVEAFDSIRKRRADAILLLVGPREDGDPLPEATLRRIDQGDGIVEVGLVPDTAPLYHLMTVFAFPSYREGLSNAVLEASAAGLPVVGARSTGVVDVVVDGVTGTLIPPRDSASLAEAILRYCEDAALRARHGVAAQAFVREHFAPEAVWEALNAEYKRGLLAAGRYVPESGYERHQPA